MSAIVRISRRRRTFRLMIRQDFKRRFGDLSYGVLWAVGEPLLMGLMMWAVFTYLLKRDSGLDPFILYLMTGILPFSWLGGSIGQGPRTFRKYGPLVSFSKLPIIIWPLRPIVVGFAEMVFAVPIVLVLMLILQVPPTWGVLLLPIALVAQFFLCMGSAMILSALGSKLPDVSQLTAILTRLLFWGSPVIWYGRDFGPLQPFMYLNPFYGLLELYRAIFWPDDVIGDPINYLLSGVIIVVLFAVGLLLLKIRSNEIRRET